MSDPFKLPDNDATRFAVWQLAAMLKTHGFAECRISPDGTAHVYLQSTADELRNVIEHSVALTGQLDRLQAEVDQLRAKVATLPGNTRSEQ